MHWLAKSALQNAIGVLPRSEEWNYLMQRRLTKRLPRGFDEFVFHAEMGLQQWQLVLPLLPEERRAAAHFYEFGAGWDLIIPLTYWALGVERQTLVDISPHVRLELINHAIATFAERGDEISDRLGVPLRRPDARPVAAMSELRERFGIDYRAPVDARETGLPTGSVDVVTSTFTLEHVPAKDITPILRESGRILRDDGVISAVIDMKDHYSYFDKTLSAFHFLRYSPRAWSVLDTSLQSVNRLRYPQYLEMVAAAGLEVLDETPEPPTEQDLYDLRRLPIAEVFARFPVEELGVRSLRVVARPRAAVATAAA